VRNRSGQWREVEQFSRHAIIIHDAQKCQAFLREKQTLSASRNRIQKSAMSRPRLIALLLALTTMVVYLPVVHDDFVNFDDQVYVTENPHVQAGLTLSGIRWAFTSFHGSNWHPLTWLSHMADCELFGLNPGAHHFVNVLFHVANVVLLFVLLLRLAGALWPCAFIAALFAWHPLHVESVAWISERKDVLSTFFALLSLLSYTEYVKKNCRRSFWFALILFALGLMSKPMLVTLPFVMLLLDYWPLKRISFSSTLDSQFSIAFEKWPFFLLVAVSCVVTYVAQLHGAAVMTLEQLSFDVRFENALIAYGRYLLDTIWPLNLAILYPLPDHLHWIHAAAATATAALFVISWLAWRTRNSCIYFIIGWLWFLGTLVPVIGLVKVGSMALADRYTYFPLIGIFIIVAFGARDLAARFQILKFFSLAAAILILIGCVTLTERQLQFWRDSETLFRRALAVTQGNGNAHINLGAALEMSGHQTEALAEYREAVRLADDNINAHFDIANLLAKMNRTTNALPEYRRAIALDPNTANLHNGLGIALADLGKFSEATNEFAVAARLDAEDPWPHFETANVLLKTGRDAEAIEELRAALRIDPDNYQILTFTAHVLAADENSAVRDGTTALALAIKANAHTGGVQPLVLDALGMACAETGDFTNATEVTQRAFDLAAAAKMKKIEPIHQRLELYKKHQPWRESFLATNAPPGNLPKN
jgi:protein O-mannosyl-transferase